MARFNVFIQKIHTLPRGQELVEKGPSRVVFNDVESVEVTEDEIFVDGEEVTELVRDELGGRAKVQVMLKKVI